MVKFDELLEHLEISEGVRLEPYLCPAGYLTIGIGRNLESHGITKPEAPHLKISVTYEGARQIALLNILEIYNDAKRRFPTWFPALDPVRRDVVIDMIYTLGMSDFLTFKDTLKAIAFGDYTAASEHMLNSKWAKQVGQRAVKDAWMMKTGAYIKT